MTTRRNEKEIVFAMPQWHIPLGLIGLFLFGSFCYNILRLAGDRHRFVLMGGVFGILGIAAMALIKPLVWRRRLAFCDGTLKFMSGSKVKCAIELRQVSRLFLRHQTAWGGRLRHRDRSYVALVDDREVELFREGS